MTTTQTAPPPLQASIAPPGRPAWYWPAVIGGSLLVISTVRVLTGANDIDSSGALMAAIGLAMPLALAGLGGLWSERAGVVNIGLEGMMIVGTWGAAFFGYHYGPWVGILGAVGMGAAFGAIHALATVIFGVDHIVSGVAINLLGAGTGSYLAVRTFTGLPGGGPTQSPPLAQLPFLSVPGLGEVLLGIEKSGTWLLADLAGILRALTTNVNALSIIGVLLLVFSGWFLWRTAIGLRLRSCGEAPYAAETLGVNVLRYKFLAVLVSGALAGLAGGFLTLVASNLYREGQTGGRGYIGLAAMIFGNWRPGGLAAGAMLFGYADAIQLRGGGDVIHAYLLPIGLLLLGWGIWVLVRRAEGKSLAGGLWRIGMSLLVLLWYAFTTAIPDEFTSMTPYIATLLVLAFSAQRLRMPAADGQVYRKGEAD